MVIQSTRKGNSIYDELKERLYIQKTIETQYAYRLYEDSELDENLEMIEDNYDINLFKLDEITVLGEKSKEIKRKFIIQKLYIEDMKIPEKVKIENILTTACLLNYHSDLLMDLSENQIYILSVASLNIGNKYGIDWNCKALLKKQIDSLLPEFNKVTESLCNPKQYVLEEIK